MTLVLSLRRPLFMSITAMLRIVFVAFCAGHVIGQLDFLRMILIALIAPQRTCEGVSHPFSPDERRTLYEARA